MTRLLVQTRFAVNAKQANLVAAMMRLANLVTVLMMPTSALSSALTKEIDSSIGTANMNVYHIHIQGTKMKFYILSLILQ